MATRSRMLLRLAAFATTVSLVGLLAAGCQPTGPVALSREALGTVVAVTAYGEDRGRVEDAVDASYDSMAAVEQALDVYDPASPIATVNESLAGTLPAEAAEVLDAINRLGVSREFSPLLLGVVEAYDFEGDGRVPSEEELASLLVEVERWRFRRDATGVYARWDERGPAGARSPEAPTGFDFGGAAKGVALDRAAAQLRESGAVDAALVTAGSTTVVIGEKPDGEPWRIGVEDPRDPQALVAVVESSGPVTVSTSGDYQRFFERNGERYHHIIDPATGMPARGFRSLTVVGAPTGLDSDVLSTALFVMGPDRAEDYVLDRGLGLVMVTEAGDVRIVEGPRDVPWSITAETP